MARIGRYEILIPGIVCRGRESRLKLILWFTNSLSRLFGVSVNFVTDFDDETGMKWEYLRRERTNDS